jgi:hypothetical protein
MASCIKHTSQWWKLYQAHLTMGGNLCQVHLTICGKLHQANLTLWVGCCQSDKVSYLQYHRYLVYKMSDVYHCYNIILNVWIIFYHDLLLSLCEQTSELSIRYNLISTCAGECDWLFHWQHELNTLSIRNIHCEYYWSGSHLNFELILCWYCSC